MRNTVLALAMLATLGINAPVFAAEPSLHEVYQAAESGKLPEAQRMMREVLQAHPNSGKAHYVEAELLVKQGQTAQAAAELATAEKLAPGLPFADAKAVSALKQSLNGHLRTATNSPISINTAPMNAPSPSGGFPWGMAAVIAGVLGFIVWASRFMSARNQAAIYPPATEPGMGGYRPAYPGSPYNGGGQSYGGAAPMPAGNTSGPGLGSQMLGGLATGAAVGAGVVAGEALMHRFMDGGSKSTSTPEQRFSSFDSIPSLPETPLNDFGGNDFGIADSGSWDDGASSGSDSDWN